jgi:hypothetical protein
MWEPRRLTTPWAFTGCYRKSFTFINILYEIARAIAADHVKKKQLLAYSLQTQKNRLL